MTASNKTRSMLVENRLVLSACLVIGLTVLVYWQSFSAMIEMWSTQTYEYGWLVYPISLYVLWRNRQALEATPVSGSWIGVISTGLTILVWILARMTGIQMIELASATLLIPCVFWAVAGTEALRKAAFPLLLLLTAVPTGEFLIQYLIESTATIATTLLQVSGVPVYRDGAFLTLPGGSFEVADVCSGLRILLAGGMASIAYAYVTYAGFVKRIMFVSIVAIILVITNGVRAFVVMYVASATEMRVFAGKDHVVFGLILFAAVFIALILFGERYADPVDSGGRIEGAASQERKGEFSIVTATAVLTLIALGPTFVFVKAQQPLPAAAIVALPELAGCQGPTDVNHDGTPANWSPDYHGADYLLRGYFDCGSFDADVYIASYLSQRQGKELISSTNRIWPKEWHRYVDETVVKLVSDGVAMDLQQVLVRAPDRQLLIWYWYQVGDSVIVSKFEAKLRNALHLLTLRPVETSVVAIAVSARRNIDVLELHNELESASRTVMSWNRLRTE